jgi:peptidoglycan/LPS O-acetylase OafA/YrhL
MPARPATSTDRLEFADLLRGLACLAVVLGHLTIDFLNDPPLIAFITMSEPWPSITVPDVLDRLLNTFSIAAMGVAVFFLISGFVIPLSLEATTVRGYFLKRFLRIFPPYWAALAICLVALSISGAVWSKSSWFTAIDYISNSFLLGNLFARPDMIAVGWTLQIEIKFYLLAPLIYMTLKRGMLIPVLLCGLAVVGIFWNATILCDNVHIACWDHYRINARMFWLDVMSIVYMLIGSVLYAHYRKLISTRQVVFGVVFLFACYQACISTTPLPIMTIDRRLPYFWGVVIFVCCYLLRGRIVLAPPFRFLANISYSLYMVHTVVGCIIMRLLMAAGVPYLVCLAVALLLVFLLATAMHSYLEAPMIALGKRLNNAWFASQRRDTVPLGLPALRG